jgi:hypothetical protein
MDLTLIAGATVLILYIAGILFMRNTHPYRGSPDEPFESKQKRRRVGLFLISTGTLVLGIAILVQILVLRG